jgi:hypothetical protein
MNPERSVKDSSSSETGRLASEKLEENLLQSTEALADLLGLDLNI